MPKKANKTNTELKRIILALIEITGEIPKVEEIRKYTKTSTNRVQKVITEIKKDLDMKETYSLGLYLGLTKEEIDQKLAEIKNLDSQWSYSRLPIKDLRTLAYRQAKIYDGTRKKLIDILKSQRGEKFQTTVEEVELRKILDQQKSLTKGK